MRGNYRKGDGQEDRQLGGLSVQILPTPTITPVPTAETCLLQAQPFFDDAQRLLDEWFDANEIAGSTPRMSLGPALADLQRIKRDVDNLVVPECAAYVHYHLSAGMGYAVDGYLAFLAQEPDSTVDRHFENAAREFKAYTDTLLEIKVQAETTATP